MIEADNLILLNKLIILYMLDSTTSPLSNAQISDFLLRDDYNNDYFLLQDYIYQLLHDKQIMEVYVHKKKHYSITSEGRITLDFFSIRIPKSVMADVTSYLESNRYEIREKLNIHAEYLPSGDDFLVHLVAKESKQLLLDLTINVPNEEKAKEMCINWKNHNIDFYKQALLLLDPEK